VAFTDFDTKIIEHKFIQLFAGKLGLKRRRHSIFVITGNKKGLCGISLSKGSDIPSTLRLAKNRAGCKVICVPIYNNHTGNE
jgi:ribosomal protein S5